MLHARILRVVAGLGLPLASSQFRTASQATPLQDSHATPIDALWTHADRWTGKEVAVEGQVYKFPGNRVTSERVLDQIVCDRISRFHPRSGGECIMFIGLPVQDLPDARRSADGGWWVGRHLRVAGTLRRDACGVPLLDVSGYWGVPS